MAQNYLKLFYDFRNEIDILTMEERGRLLTAMLEYAETGRLPEGALTGNERILFPVCRQRIDRDAEAYERKARVNRANGERGGRPRKNPLGFQETEKSQDKDKDKDKDEDKDEGEDKDDARARTASPEPTLEEVRDACRTDAPSVDPEHFLNHYRANGWRAGSQPILDWRAKLRDWEAGNHHGPAPAFRAAGPPGRPDPALNYEQREYREEDFGDDFFFDVVKAYGDPR